MSHRPQNSPDRNRLVRSCLRPAVRWQPTGWLEINHRGYAKGRPVEPDEDKALATKVFAIVCARNLPAKTWVK